jgi:hypothetical protein
MDGSNGSPPSRSTHLAHWCRYQFILAGRMPRYESSKTSFKWMHQHTYHLYHFSTIWSKQRSRFRWLAENGQPIVVIHSRLRLVSKSTMSKSSGASRESLRSVGFQSGFYLWFNSTPQTASYEGVVLFFLWRRKEEYYPWAKDKSLLHPWLNRSSISPDTKSLLYADRKNKILLSFGIPAGAWSTSMPK